MCGVLNHTSPNNIFLAISSTVLLTDCCGNLTKLNLMA